MHHYKCQNVYISATSSERIVDTLECFPSNSPTPQLSSTERLLMAENDTTNALRQPHPEVPFSQVGDDTITALTQLAEIFKNQFQKPKSPKLTHAPIKEAKNKRLTVGGNILDNSSDVATSIADITAFKFLIKSTLSTEDAAMMMMEINYYYMGTLLPRYEYMRMLLSRFPEEIVTKYNLAKLAVDGWGYIEIRKGMY
jgi:hypothetical protein